MNKEKQIIEEMARFMCANYDGEKGSCGDGMECDHDCWAYREATHLYNAGYRKQSEGEWLPSLDGIQPIRCSKCNMPAPFVAGENEFGDFEICRYPSRYCHECGAKMKGGEQG